MTYLCSAKMLIGIHLNYLCIKQWLCDRLEGRRGSMKLNSLSWIIVGAISSCAILYAVNKQRDHDIVRRCEAVQYRNKMSQLKACNGFLRTKRGCFLPPENSTLDRSCLDKKLSERVYQSCIDDQGFWGYPIENKEGSDRLVTLSS